MGKIDKDKQEEDMRLLFQEIKELNKRIGELTWDIYEIKKALEKKGIMTRKD